MRTHGVEGQPGIDGTAAAGIDPLPRPRTAVQVAPPAALSAPPNIFSLLIALRRRWLLAVSLGLLLAPGAGLIAWMMKPITFTARSYLVVKSIPDVVLYELRDAKGDFGNYQRVQIALVKSRPVINSALRDEKVAELPLVRKQEDPVAWLEREIQADFATAPEIMRIAMTGETPEALPILVDAVRNAYLVEIVQKEANARRKRLDRLKKNYAEYESSLREKRLALKRMALEVGSKDPKVLSAVQALSQEHLRGLQSELLKRRSELRTARLELAIHESSDKALTRAAVPVPISSAVTVGLLATPFGSGSCLAAATMIAGRGSVIPDAALDELFRKDPIAQRYMRDIGGYEQDLAGLRDRSPAPEAEPLYQQTMRSLESAKAALAKYREQSLPNLKRQIQEKSRDEQQQARLQQADKVAFLVQMERELTNEFERHTETTERFKAGVVDLEWLQDEITHLDTVSKDFGKQMTALEIEQQAPPRVEQLEEAIVMPAQTEASRLRNAGAVGFGTFAAVLLAVAFLESRLRRVSSPDEVVQGLKMKLVGSLPLVPRRALHGRAGSARNSEWQQRLTESVDAIRTTLLNAARHDGLRVVMVTSAVGGEGKTLLSCHLAVSLARAGCKTLLLDGDLRRPYVHKLFGMPLERGFSELLRGEANLDEVVRPGPLDALSIISAGKSDLSAIQLLARDRMQAVLQQFADYEFVVIDSAPVLPVADAQLIGQHVDGVVFSVMRDVSRLPLVYEAYERLALLRVRILGAVVNGMPSQGYALYYGESQRTAPAAANV